MNTTSQNGKSAEGDAAWWFGSKANKRMRLQRFTKPWPMFTLLLAVFPTFLIPALLAYAVQAYVHLGHWPSYNNPDPKQLGWVFQHTALQLGFMASPLTPLLTICLAVFGRIRSRDFPIWIAIIAAIASIALLVSFGRLDPGGVVTWFWD